MFVLTALHLNNLLGEAPLPLSPASEQADTNTELLHPSWGLIFPSFPLPPSPSPLLWGSAENLPTQHPLKRGLKDTEEFPCVTTDPGTCSQNINFILPKKINLFHLSPEKTAAAHRSIRTIACMGEVRLLENIPILKFII